MLPSIRAYRADMFPCSVRVLSGIRTKMAARSQIRYNNLEKVRLFIIVELTYSPFQADKPKFEPILHSFIEVSVKMAFKAPGNPVRKLHPFEESSIIRLNLLRVLSIINENCILKFKEDQDRL